MATKNPVSEVRSVDLLVKNLLASPKDLDELKINPEQVLKQKAEEAKEELPARVLELDKWIYRTVVGALSFVLIAVVVGIVYRNFLAPIPNLEIKVPDIITALSSACVGALAGILAPSPVAKR